MKLTPYEQETVISFNEEDAAANVYTHNQKLTKKLKELSLKFPDQFYPEKGIRDGAVCYSVPKKCIGIRPPYPNERREADSKRAKQAGITSPDRRGSHKAK